MQEYFERLMSSSIPLPRWAVIVLWVILYTAARILFRKSGSVSEAQNHFKTESTAGLIRQQSWKLLFFQLLMTAFVFGYACWFGGGIFTLFAGGWLVTTAVSIPMNLRIILLYRALSRPGAATGEVTFSKELIVQNLAFQLFEVATFCLLVAIVTAHLALFGGAFFLAVTGVGYLRKGKMAK
jgi:hypothetical protein